ncbi:DUF1996 domain-containing protein [Phycicoccus sp. CSK15P-2]|uniref:DUF1996 domain-containing protein n=1 Tax=Phycicoccus sp. CSK15P-2 TaxID=2807627 RepID=UPI0019518FC6|nr:DUF1996 domain-containing protein [Phycicoccus sp. CSK15P-2]MBM6404530.1 DUF1996 domain-containing protein [Phycicoccus sp. CSK15P-2]
MTATHRTSSPARATGSPPGLHRRGLRPRPLAAVALAGALVTAGVLAAPPAGAADSELISQGHRAFSSSTEGAGTAARFAVDGDPSTRWSSEFSDEQWLRVDLGAPAHLDEVVLQWEAAYGAQYAIQVSDDGASWSTVASVTDGDGGTDTLDVDAEGRYVQMLGQRRGTGYGYSLFELQVFGTGGAPVDDDEPPVFDDEVTHHEFQANCTAAHLESDDPIVYPGQPGRSHLHTFIGNTSTDADTTIESLFAHPETTCTNPKDHSAYWFPSIYDGDTPVEPTIHETVYYKAGIEDYRSVQPFPEGLRFVAGDMMATPDSFRDAPGAVEGWECGDLSKQWSIPDHCTPGTQLNIRYQAPSCWDGVNLDSPDHQSHMAYPVSGECPLDHPVPVPMLEFKIAWPVSGDMTQVRLASGSDQSWHYDFMNAWEPEILDALVTHCINGGLQCNPRGYDQYKPHRGAALTEDYELP